ncbi:MAG: HAMP domain-containing sensor histidine kinase [Chloroflexota bacterium]|nr:HAMP domain-containing sensor histidine kinase [Chloroflexota bacterium]
MANEEMKNEEMRNDKCWPHKRPHPPWAGWDHDRKFSRRRPARQHQGPLLFLRFAGVFGAMALLVLGGMATFAFLLSRLFEGSGRMASLVRFGGCGLSLALPLLAALLAARAFRGIATPLADVMAAADAVAEGDLSVRVPVSEYDHGEFSRLAESFNRMTAELERTDQRRRNLTADVAHELRTPLHIIQGNLEGILDDVYEPTAEHITATLDETRALARLVDDLRTLSLAEAGQLPLVREPVDVSELLADVATSFSGQTEAAGIDLHVEPALSLVLSPVEGLSNGPARSSLTITGDVGRLDQVLNNLMGNALRHTPSGGTITLRAEPIEGGVRISVCDTGEGIPAEELPYIFDRFWRGDQSRSHAHGAGSGLGLAIARQLVQVHGGHIGVESEPGRGTTFTIKLPAGGT